MNKFLMMSAAAIVATASAAAPTVARAGSATLSFNSAYGYGTYCDSVTVNWNGTIATESDDLMTYCGLNEVSQGVGQIGWVKGQKKTMIMGDNQFGYFYPGAPYELTFTISYPVKQGGTWQLIFTSDGVNGSVLNSGTYNVVSGGAHKPTKGGVSMVQAAINAGKIKAKTAILKAKK